MNIEQFTIDGWLPNVDIHTGTIYWTNPNTEVEIYATPCFDGRPGIIQVDVQFVAGDTMNLDDIEFPNVDASYWDGADAQISDHPQWHEYFKLMQSRMPSILAKIEIKTAKFAVKTTFDSDEPIVSAWQNFAQNNSDSPKLVAEVFEAMKSNRIYKGGGGAAPTFTVERIQQDAK